MKYYPKHSLVTKIFYVFMGGGALWVSVEYSIGKRQDYIEFIIALFMLVVLPLTLAPKSIEINTDKKEISIEKWFGLYNKKYKPQDIKDLYVEYSNSIDNWHSIMATIGSFNVILYEHSANDKGEVIESINEVYSQLSTITGIAKREFMYVANS